MKGWAIVKNHVAQHNDCTMKKVRILLEEGFAKVIDKTCQKLIKKVTLQKETFWTEDASKISKNSVKSYEIGYRSQGHNPQEPSLTHFQDRLGPMDLNFLRLHLVAINADRTLFDESSGVRRTCHKTGLLENSGKIDCLFVWR